MGDDLSFAEMLLWIAALLAGLALVCFAFLRDRGLK